MENIQQDKSIRKKMISFYSASGTEVKIISRKYYTISWKLHSRDRYNPYLNRDTIRKKTNLLTYKTLISEQGTQMTNIPTLMMRLIKPIMI